MNSAVSQHWGAVEAVALPISRSPGAIRVSAEYDDLVQEGAIQVWQNLERKVEPMHYVEFRMLDYIRWLGTMQSVNRDGSTPYEALLPLDDFRNVQAAD